MCICPQDPDIQTLLDRSYMVGSYSGSFETEVGSYPINIGGILCEINIIPPRSDS